MGLTPLIRHKGPIN